MAKFTHDATGLKNFPIEAIICGFYESLLPIVYPVN